MTTKQKIIIKDKIPYSALTVSLTRMKELNESPELWAEFLTRIKSKVLEDESFPPNTVTELFEMEMTTIIDTTLVKVMQNPIDWVKTTLNFFEYDIELRYEINTVIIVFRREWLVSVEGENIP
jgi:hypothetical protein